MPRPSRTAARLAPAQMCENHPAVGRLGAGRAGQFLHQVLIGEAVKAVTLDPHPVVFPRDRQQPGHPRHLAVERRIETGHLRHGGPPAADRLHQCDLVRHVIGVERADAPQFVEQFLRDPFRPRVARRRHAPRGGRRRRRARAPTTAEASRAVGRPPGRGPRLRCVPPCRAAATRAARTPRTSRGRPSGSTIPD